MKVFFATDDDDSEPSSPLSKKYSSLILQVRRWNEIKEKHKKELYKFILKIIEHDELRIVEFYKNMQIKTRISEFNTFIRDEHYCLSKYNRMQTYAHIFDEQTESRFKTRIKRISRLMNTMISMTKWIRDQFKVDILVHIQILDRVYDNEFILSNKKYLVFLQKFLIGICTFLRSLKAEIKAK